MASASLRPPKTQELLIRGQFSIQLHPSNLAWRQQPLFFSLHLWCFVRSEDMDTTSNEFRCYRFVDLAPSVWFPRVPVLVLRRAAAGAHLRALPPAAAAAAGRRIWRLSSELIMWAFPTKYLAFPMMMCCVLYILGFKLGLPSPNGEPSQN